MVQLNSCCGCCSLRTGSIIVAVLDILLSLCFFIEGIDETGQSQISIGLSLIFYSLVAIIFNLLQIYGAAEKKENYMLPSIILRFIILGLMIILVIIGFFAIITVVSIAKFRYHHGPIPRDVKTKTVLGILILLALSLGIYSALIPLSYYNKLKLEGNLQPQVAFENTHSRSTACECTNDIQ